MQHLFQGDILKIEKIKHPVFVASKDFFNTSGEIIGCPIINNSKPGPLHIWISTEHTEGYIHCEKLALLDLSIPLLPDGLIPGNHIPAQRLTMAANRVQSRIPAFSCPSYLPDLLSLL